MVRIGINYNIFYSKNFGIDSPLEFLSFLHKLQFKNIFVQLGSESSRLMMNENELFKLNKAKNEYAFNILIHFPEDTSIMDKRFEIKIAKILESCKIFDSFYIVVHFPETTSPMGKIILEKLNLAASLGVRVCLENPIKGYYSRIDNVIRFFKQYKEFYFTLDTGHLNFALNGNLNSFATSIANAYSIKDIIKVLHIHLNEGVEDQHLSLSPQVIRRIPQMYEIVKDTIRVLGKNSIIIQEIRPKDETELKAAILQLKNIVES